MRSIAESPPWLVVTDDGRRPWHREFRVRETEDGRWIAYWWGSGSDPCRLGYYLRAELLVYSPAMLGKHDLCDRISIISHVLLGSDWRSMGVESASPHQGSCNPAHYVGIAFLPQSPNCWRPDAVWPGWKHLAHGRKECTRAW